MRQKDLFRHGFTLIELLVVISVMAALLAFALPNYLGARERARDAKLKSEMVALKNALRMYYNDYQHYPLNDSSWPLNGCGSTGSSACNTTDFVCPGFWFAAGGSDGCGSIYMKKPPTINSSNGAIRYYTPTSNAGDNFMICVEKLENASDPDILESQKCYAEGTNYNYPSPSSYGPYCVCSD